MNAIEERVLELIGEDVSAPDVFTSANIAPIRDSINEAIAEIVMLTGGYKRQYFIPLRELTGFYRMLPTAGEVGWITDVFLVNPRYRLIQTDLLKLNAEDPRWMVSSSQPNYYIPIGQDVIGFHPKPSSNSDVVEITMVEIPSEYTSESDRIKLRDSYQYATVNYAVSDFWASRGDAIEAAKYMQLYMDAMGLGAMRDAQPERIRYERTK